MRQASRNTKLNHVKPHTNGSKVLFERLEASSRVPKMHGRLQSDQCVRVLVSTKRKDHALSHPNICCAFSGCGMLLAWQNLLLVGMSPKLEWVKRMPQKAIEQKGFAVNVTLGRIARQFQLLDSRLFSHNSSTGAMFTPALKLTPF